MSDAFPPVCLRRTEDRSIFSRLLNREYQLAIALPWSYASSQHSYPVLYLLDSDVYFGMASDLVPNVRYHSSVPEIIVVGIGYKDDYEQWGRLRELDFKMPEVQPDTPDSHADRFLAALQQEIIPFVEDSYRADARQRILYGYSSSGFFCMYALANAPDLFRAYLAGSPDTDLSAVYLPTHDQKLSSRQVQDPLDVYISIGSLEGEDQSTLPTYHQLVAHFQAKNYPGLRLITEIYEGENHSAGGNALTLIRGLRNCFPTVK